MDIIAKAAFDDGEFDIIGGWHDGIESFYVSVYDRDGEIHWSSVYHGMVDVQDIYVLDECLKQLNVLVPDGFWNKVNTDGDSFHRFVEGRWMSMGQC